MHEIAIFSQTERMIVYYVLLGMSMVYLCNIPVSVRLAGSLPENAHVSIAVGVFGRGVFARTFSVREIQVHKIISPQKTAKLGGSRKAYHYLAKRARYSWSFRFAMSDACKTAQFAGLIRVVTSALRVPARVQPDFLRADAFLTARGIATVSLGHIMLAALWRLGSMILWRVQTWRNIRLKAS